MNENQIQTLLQALRTLQDLGKVAYFNKGAYNSETTYEINDVVSYNGSSYVSLGNDNLGNLPTNTAFWSLVASKGEKGDTGKAFVIEKTYASISDMVADYDNMNVNDYVMIQGSIEDEENATLWTKTETEVSPYKWVYLADFSGASGITGATPNIQIGTVTEGNEPSVTRRAGSTNENPILDFVLKTGATGATGATGNGISEVAKTSTSGLVDTYTISYTSGNSSTFDVHNGKGISSIAKTSSVGLVDTYTITYNDGTTSTFEITNGEDGEVTQEQLDETNAEVERVNMVYNALPKVSGEGTDLTLNNTAECPVYEVGLRPSELSQAPSSRNLVKIDNNNAIVYSNYNHYNINDGVITTTSGNTLVGFKVKVDANTDYTLQGYSDFTDSTGTYALRTREYSAEPTDWDTNFLHQESVNMVDETKNVLSITTTQTTAWVLVVVYCNKAGLTLNNIQFEEGTQATDYKPYVSPTPTPDYPQDIHVVSGENEVKIQNKNLLNRETCEENIILVWTTGVIYADTGSITSDYILANANETFTTNYKCNVFAYDNNKNYLGNLNNAGKLIKSLNSQTSFEHFTLPNSNEIKYIKIEFRKAVNSDVDLLTANLQLEKGSTATSYVEHQEQTYPLSLGDLEYCKIGNYEDEFFKNVVGSEYYDSTLELNKWYLKKNIEKINTKITFNSTSFTNLFLSQSTLFQFKYVTQQAFLNYFKNVVNTNIINNSTANENLQNNEFCFRWADNIENKDRLYVKTNLTLEQLNDLMILLYYVSNTPTYILLNNTLQTQLDNLSNAISYEQQTNVSQANDDLPFTIKMSAIRDLNGIFDLISQSEEI